MSNFKVGDIVKTRDGREVKILCVDAPGAFPIIGFMADGFPSCWTLNGQVCDDDHKRGADLIPPKRTREVTVFLNIYPTMQTFHCSEDVARYNTQGCELAVAVPVTFTVEW